jgi:hypothetical protein
VSGELERRALAPAERARLGELEARQLTDEVKRDAEALREKLLRLYEGEAHIALGYSSWRAYWEAEFETHWRTGYRELEAARVDRAIGPWANGPLPERQARELVPLLDRPDELAEVLRALHAEHGDRLTAAKMRQAVDERMRLDRRVVTVTSSLSAEWYTPAPYVEAAREVLGTIDLDPASCELANRTVKAARFFDAGADGLTRAWYGRVWLNPPYGPLCAPFVARALAEHAAGRVPAAVLLLNAYSVDTRWFRPLWDELLCFSYDRIHMFGLDGEAARPSAGSVFVYLGTDRGRFARVFETFGAVVQRATFGGERELLRALPRGAA